MKILNKDTTFCYDVDDTLIMHSGPDDSGAMKFNFYGQDRWAVPHLEHIKLLKASVVRDRNVIVWSGNGYAWAKEVLTKLGLDQLDVTVMSKPAGYCDDVDVEKWHGNRVYIPFNPFKKPE